MASMSFDAPVVSVLMNLVDEHREELKESDYIKICNAMKHLHTVTNYNPVSESLSTTQHMSDQPEEPTVSIEQQRIENEVDNCLREVYFYQSRLSDIHYNCMRFPVKNAHRQQVIEEINGVLITGLRGGKKQLKTIEINKYLQEMLSLHKIQSVDEFENKAKIKAEDEKRRTLENLRMDLERWSAKLRRAQQTQRDFMETIR